MADLSKLKRNDVKGAMVIYRAEWKATGGKPDPDLVHTLFMLQDDTSKLGDALEAFAVEHGID